jgi:Holliday junction resolvase RusA-like endonuclease
MPSPVVSFWVAGRPRTQGSKRAFIVPRKGGGRPRVVLTDDAGEEGKAWRSQVRDAALAAWGDFRPALEGPVSVTFTFHTLRPQSHFGSGRNCEQLKEHAPAFPVSRPDVLKCARAIEDSLTSVIWRDDAQIVTELLLKRYGKVQGVQVDVYADAHSVLEHPDAKQLMLL